MDLLIFVLLLWMWFWDYPADSPGQRLVSVLAAPFCWLGLWHNWAMFAPDPIQVNRRLKARIILADGAVDEWRPIEPRRANWFVDLLWFRQFKYQFSVLSGANRVLWEPLCHWLIQQAEHHGDSVACVQLVREYQMVQPPGSPAPLSEWKAALFYEQRAADRQSTADAAEQGQADGDSLQDGRMKGSQMS